jgi:murein DD-endopeptidase MepM/ murein hydrolase activator NlpD
VVQKNVSEYIENQEVYSRGRGWIVQSGQFESSRTTDEYKLYTSSPNQNAIIRTSQWNVLRKSTKSRPMTSPHIGTDFRARVDTDLYSLGDGTVISADRDKGNLVVEYQNGDRVTFRHLNSIGSFDAGDQIYEGQIIGQTGKRRTSVPHLHVDAVSNTGEQVNIEDREYGSVTNELFFGVFKGDYKKLKAYNEGVKNGDVKSHKQKDYSAEDWKKLIDELINN